MEPNNEIDDTAYFRTLRAQEEEGPWKARYGGTVKWDISPEVEHAGEYWLARVYVLKMPGIREYTLDVPGHFDSEGAANRAAVDWATDWIAQQPVE